MIYVTDSISLDEREIQEDFVRASGPGGQNVNKLSTAAQLRFDTRRITLAEDAALRLNRLAGQVRKPAPLEVIQAGIGKEVRLVRVADVVYFESDSRYTRVVYSEAGVDAEVLIRTPLKELIAQLDATRFWQIHRAVIVNQRCIASAVRIDEGNMVLTLRGRSEKLPVSRHFQGLFRGQ